MTLGAVDHDFPHMVRAAALGDTKALIDYLLSDRHIGPTERQYLADLLAGEFRRRKGRPTLKAPARAFRNDALAQVKALKAELKSAGKKTSHHQVLDEVARKLGISFDTLSEWDRTKKHRK